MKFSNEIVIIVGSIILLTTIYPIKGDGKPTGLRRNIFKSPDVAEVSEAEYTSTPWVKDEFVPIIQKFIDDVFENLKKSPQVQKTWGYKIDSKTIRYVYFKVCNKFLTSVGHVQATSLANIISKAASLNDPYTMAIFFEAIAINLAQTFLAHYVEMDRGAAKKYVDLISEEFDKIDLYDLEAIFTSTYAAYDKFITSYGFNLKEVIDEEEDLFVSALIVLSEKKK